MHPYRLMPDRPERPTCIDSTCVLQRPAAICRWPCIIIRCQLKSISSESGAASYCGLSIISASGTGRPLISTGASGARPRLFRMDDMNILPAQQFPFDCGGFDRLDDHHFDRGFHSGASAVNPFSKELRRFYRFFSGKRKQRVFNTSEGITELRPIRLLPVIGMKRGRYIFGSINSAKLSRMRSAFWSKCVKWSGWALRGGMRKGCSALTG